MTSSLNLQVAEALARDVGRGIARLDPKDMARIEASVGDIVFISGKRTTVAKLMPAYPKERGKELVQIDGITRENAQSGLGEKVELQRIEPQLAQTVVVSPITRSRILEKDSQYIGRVLEGLAAVSGDKVRANLFGNRYLEFLVADTQPKGPVVLSHITTIKVKAEGPAGREKTGTTYEDIGGLHREVHRIREMIELPLKYPGLFERLGIEPPKGILLYGPPGCGKTLIARAVANETDALFLSVSGPEVIHKFYGESEAHLRAIFDKASQNAPAIIFLDELDAIASKREEVRGDQQVERRVVAQLLALMDGLKSRGQVIVIGATNIPQVLDPALRRPGRFDRELSIPIPDKKGRLEVLHVHTRGMPLAADVDLERLAGVTHGFVGADLEALCREAAMCTLRQALPQIQLGGEDLPEGLLLELEVKMDHFLDALKEVEPSALREVFTEISEVEWEDVGGLEEAKRVLAESIEWPLQYPELFRQANTRPPKGILLTGPPGTGKTLLAKAAASKSGVNFISVKGPALLSKWVGESERGIREVFKKAKQASPCLIFFDELDALAPSRGAGGDSHVAERVVSQLLAELDGIEELKGVVVLAATNRPDIIDPALLRAGRFELRLELPLPDARAREEIFRIHTRGKPVADDIDLQALAVSTQGLAGSDIEALCRYATLLAIREFIQEHGPSPGTEVTFRVASRHFAQAMRELQPQGG